MAERRETGRTVTANAQPEAAGASPGDRPVTGGPKLGRRAIMRRAVVGVSAVTALGMMANGPTTAEASSRTTVVGPSSANYGLAVSEGDLDPVATGSVPPLGGLLFGVISSITGSPVSPSRSAGVLGLANSQVGVEGLARTGIGVVGSTPDSGTGVFGGSQSGIGVYANSNAGTALFATAPGRGVWGRATSGLGVFGQVTQAGYGVYGAAPLAFNTWAGFFEGNVYVTGRVTQGGVAASGAQTSDGSQVTLYSLDTAEPLVEDVGADSLVGGRADVKLDPGFAAVADAGAYQVFLTPEGDCKGLYVTAKTSGSFTVRELQGGTSSLPFSYRVVAKRQGAAGKRLERLERPKGLSSQELQPPKLPEATATGDRPRQPVRR